MTVKRIGFAYNPTFEAAIELSARAAGWCRMRGIGEWEIASGDTVALARELPTTDVLVVLGGDGTFLRAAMAVAEVDVPLIGINLGKVGFLSKAEAGEMERVLGTIVAGEYTIEERMALEAHIRRGAASPARGGSADGAATPDADGERLIALNDIVVARGSLARVCRLDVAIDDSHVATFVADGLVVSSPTGSTGYSFSAGGPIVWPDLEAILVVPNNAHALFARPMVTSPNAAIAIEIEADGHDALVFCDGRREMVVPAGGRLEVTRCGTPLKWVRLDGAPFTDRLVRKFRLPVTGWRGQ